MFLRNLGTHLKVHKNFPTKKTSSALLTLFSPEDGGSIFLRSIGTHLQVHTVTQSIRPPRATLSSYEQWVFVFF
jgi:hypothetical protein